MNVETICTTDDPADTLEFHKQLKDTFEIPVLPTFRPDNVIKTEDPVKFNAYVERLENASGLSITNFDSLIESLDNRHKFFHLQGGRLSDHGMDRFYFTQFTAREADRIFKNLLKGGSLSPEETEKFRTAVMLELCRMNHKRGWTQQFHVGAMRNNNIQDVQENGTGYRMGFNRCCTGCAENVKIPECP